MGAAFSIRLAEELKTASKYPNDAVVLCSFGDASLNHSVAQGALNAGSWIAHGNLALPLVWICEDNGIGISGPTPKHWIETSVATRPHLEKIDADGLNLADTLRAARAAEHHARVRRRPVFLHIKTVRLLGHAGSDIESQYLSQAAIEATERDDPLLHSARLLIEAGYATAEDIAAVYEQVRAEVERAAQRALPEPRLSSAEEVMASIVPAPIPSTAPLPSEEERRRIFGEVYEQLQQPRNLCQLINFALTDIMLQYPNTLVFGEDVARKGGVYRVTADLMARFGRRRVFDSLLDETTILGQAIGLAHNGFVPIPEIQFLAYLHNAEDQLRGEAATLSFFSKRAVHQPYDRQNCWPCLPKRFGGHFHNDNSIAVLRDLPG